MDRDAGYSIHPSMLSGAEVTALLRAVDSEGIPRSRAGARHVLGCAPIASVATDPRFLHIASEWLGASALPFKATLFHKSQDSNWLVAWHQDTALPLATRADQSGWGPWSIKDGIVYAHAPASALQRVIALRLHLDDSAADNGPLRVLPGTHVLGVLSDAQVHEQAQRIAAQECCAAAGGVVAMRPLVIHGSSKSLAAKPRRVLHIEYAASLEIAPGLQLRAA